MRMIYATRLAYVFDHPLTGPENGREGLSALMTHQPDVTFVDYEMPEMNGLDFITRVRALDSDLRMTALIMLTGHSDGPRLRAARDRGVTEFLAKPVAARTILARLQSVILHPRPFILSGNYFGPDRRRRNAEDYAGPRRRASDSTVDTLEI